MPLNIKNEETHQRAKRLAEITNTSITIAVDTAIREALERRQSKNERLYRSLIEDLREIAIQTASLPVNDRRSSDEIVGYDEMGSLNNGS